MARPPDRGSHPNRQVGPPDPMANVIEGKLRAQEAWNTMSPEERTKANYLKEAIPRMFAKNTYVDLEHESESGRARMVVVPEDVENHGAYLADWASKNPPKKITPKAEKSKIPYSLRKTNG